MSSFVSKNPREEGNKCFHLVYSDANGARKHPLWKMRQLQEALQHYNAGKSRYSNDPSEWLKCTRSIGVVYLRMVCDESIRKDKEADWVMQCFKNSLSSFCAALSNGLGLQPLEWCNLIVLKIAETVDAASKFVSERLLSWQDRCSFLDKCQQLSSEAGYMNVLPALFLQLSIANEMRKTMIRADVDKDWKTALYMTEEVNRPLCLAESFLEKSRVILAPLSLPTFEEEPLEDAIQEIQKDKIYYSAVSAANQNTYLARVIYEQVIGENESLDMEMIWICIDYYSAALKMLQEGDEYRCYETAAKISSSLGKIFGLVLKNDVKAHGLFLNAIQFAEIVKDTSGATFFSQSWYQEAKREIEAYRKRREAFDAAEVARQRGPILEKLKTELIAIDAAMDKFEGKAYRGHALLVHIYQAHPPKNGDTLPKDLDRDDMKQMKKTLLFASRSYHPDMKHNKDKGIEWQVLCEEIIKRINNCYEFFK